MTDLPASPLSKKKYFLVLFAFLAVFYTVAPYVLGGILSVIYPTTDVEISTALVDAKITDVWMNRQYYLYYLNGDNWRMHDFNGFVAANPAARTGKNRDIGWDPSDLAHYLTRGDRITKAANSPRLAVRRGAVITHWIMSSATPESQVPAPEPPFIANDDSVVIP